MLKQLSKSARPWCNMAENLAGEGPGVHKEQAADREYMKAPTCWLGKAGCGIPSHGNAVGLADVKHW